MSYRVERGFCAGFDFEETFRMDVKIRASLEFTVSEGGLEDALAEYDEITVSGLIKEVIDKAIACDAIQAKVEDGPNTLEEYDELLTSSQS